jgi:hypothetical protein
VASAGGRHVDTCCRRFDPALRSQTNHERAIAEERAYGVPRAVWIPCRLPAHGPGLSSPSSYCRRDLPRAALRRTWTWPLAVIYSFPFPSAALHHCSARSCRLPLAVAHTVQ